MNRLAQDYLDNGVVIVRDDDTARNFLKRGSCSEEQFDKLVKVIAKVGCLQVRFRQLSEVKQVMKGSPETPPPSEAIKP